MRMCCVGSRKQFKEKRQAGFESLEQALLEATRILNRCPEDQRVSLVIDKKVDIMEFMDKDYDCRTCPGFLECLGRDHFFNNPDWEFKWLKS